MSSRTRKTLVATAPDGTEATEQTSGGYTVAGLIQSTSGQWFIARHGNSWDSVKNRTSALYHRGYYKAMHVSDLIEVTAPVVREYFGTHAVSVTSVYRPGSYEKLTEKALRDILLWAGATSSHVDSAILVAMDRPGKKGHAGVQASHGIVGISYDEDGSYGLNLHRSGWEPAGGSRPAGCHALRQMAREGVTAFEVRGPGGRTADFQAPEVLKSMNARKAR